jgi:His/Glu/Gln/Arg/opine family amino acid ABC transporter permease subunit
MSTYREVPLRYTFRWDVIWDHLPYLLAATSTTLLITFAAFCVGIGIGLVGSAGRLSPYKAISIPVFWYVQIFRNTPPLVQLMWIYYCLPLFVGINLSPIVSGCVALSLNAGAYITEIFRSGIQSVPCGQIEPGIALSLTHLQIWRRIILPLAVRIVLPALTNELVAILKYSSLVSVIGVAELTYRAQVVALNTFRPLEMFTALAAVYFVLCTSGALAVRSLEKRLHVHL